MAKLQITTKPDRTGPCAGCSRQCTMLCYARMSMSATALGRSLLTRLPAQHQVRGLRRLRPPRPLRLLRLLPHGRGGADAPRALFSSGGSWTPGPTVLHTTRNPHCHWPTLSISTTTVCSLNVDWGFTSHCSHGRPCKVLYHCTTCNCRPVTRTRGLASMILTCLMCTRTVLTSNDMPETSQCQCPILCNTSLNSECTDSLIVANIVTDPDLKDECLVRNRHQPACGIVQNALVPSWPRPRIAEAIRRRAG